MEEVPFGKFGFIKKQSLDWIKDHLSTVAVGTALFIIGLMVVSRWLKGDAQVDYLAAEAAYHHWEGNKSEQFKKLQKIIRKHPELHAKYDGAIAQKLLSSSEGGLAMSYGKAVLKRMGDFSPYYKDFSYGSLLVADQKYDEAMKSAKALKESMDADEAFWEKKSSVVRHGCILYAYNLLRIAMLEKRAGTPEGELSAWRALKENAGWSGNQPASKSYDPEAYRCIEENFKNQEISLLDYIQHREEVLEAVPKLQSDGL